MIALRYNLFMTLFILSIIAATAISIGVIYVEFEHSSSSSNDSDGIVGIFALMWGGVFLFYRFIRKSTEKLMIDQLVHFLETHRVKHNFKGHINHNDFFKMGGPAYDVSSYLPKGRKEFKNAGENYIEVDDPVLKFHMKKSEVVYELTDTTGSGKSKTTRYVSIQRGIATIFEFPEPFSFQDFHIIRSNSRYKSREYIRDYDVYSEEKVEGYSILYKQLEIQNKLIPFMRANPKIQSVSYVGNHMIILEDGHIFEMPFKLFMTNHTVLQIQSTFKKEVYHLIEQLDDYVFSVQQRDFDVQMATKSPLKQEDILEAQSDLGELDLGELDLGELDLAALGLSTFDLTGKEQKLSELTLLLKEVHNQKEIETESNTSHTLN